MSKNIDDVLCNVCSIDRENEECGQTRKTCIFLKEAKHQIGEMIKECLFSSNEDFLGITAALQNLAKLGIEVKKE